jgi:cytoskeletal protein CcmA (bactofilin family)
MWKKPEETNAQPVPNVQPVPAPPPMSAAPAPAAAPAAPKERAALGASITVVGDLSGEEDLVILGRVEGRVDLAQNSVTIGRSGRVQADIFAKTVAVEGEVQGNVYAGESIVLRKSGSVHGNLVSPRVTLEDGCKFKGAIDMDPQASERARSAARPPVRAAEAKPGDHRNADNRNVELPKAAAVALPARV